MTVRLTTRHPGLVTGLIAGFARPETPIRLPLGLQRSLLRTGDAGTRPVPAFDSLCRRNIPTR